MHGQMRAGRVLPIITAARSAPLAGEVAGFISSLSSRLGVSEIQIAAGLLGVVEH